jgi:hypothetical protein
MGVNRESEDGEMRARLGITSVRAEDHRFDDIEMVNFIVECFVQTGGIQAVCADLNRLGLWTALDIEPYDLLDSARATGILELGDRMKAAHLRNVCASIVDTLEECKELEILTSLTYSEAQELLARIS